MMNYTYNVNAHLEKAEITFRTNDVGIAIQEFFDYVANGIHCDITNGLTGEVLAIVNCPDQANYASEEMAQTIRFYNGGDLW